MALKDSGKKGVGKWAGAGRGRSSKWHIHPGKKARKDESIAMRVKKKRTPKQLAASRDDSYGKWGSKAKKRGRINLSSGGMALRGHGAEIR